MLFRWKVKLESCWQKHEAESLLDVAKLFPEATAIKRVGVSRNPLSRLLSKVTITDGGCWEWQAATFQKGYGRFSYNGKTLGAHRVSWELHHGPVPDDLWVLHECDNPPCVNPAHLFLGDVRDNNADRAAKDRNKRNSG